MKACKQCGVPQEYSKFYKNKNMGDGYLSICKKCNKSKEIQGRNRVTKIRQMYKNQRKSSKRRGHPAPNYTVDELIKWCLDQPLYHSLYTDWKASHFPTWLAPSCNRIDDYKPYTLDNIQLMTWKENSTKAYTDKCDGTLRKQLRGVVQIDEKTGHIVEHYSMQSASRKTGVSQPNIHKVCNKQRKSAGGYKWEYKQPVTK